MTELPNENQIIAPGKDIEKMFNRTREFVIENARQQREDCSDAEEDYFAQDIFVFNVTEPANTQPSKIILEHVMSQTN